MCGNLTFTDHISSQQLKDIPGDGSSLFTAYTPVTKFLKKTQVSFLSHSSKGKLDPLPRWTLRTSPGTCRAQAPGPGGPSERSGPLRASGRGEGRGTPGSSTPLRQGAAPPLGRAGGGRGTAGGGRCGPGRAGRPFHVCNAAAAHPALPLGALQSRPCDGVRGPGLAAPVAAPAAALGDRTGGARGGPGCELGASDRAPLRA